MALRAEEMMRITENGKTRNYIKGVERLLEEGRSDGNQEVVLWAKGRSINKLVTVVGVVRRKYPSLEQKSEISWEEERKESEVEVDDDRDVDQLDEERREGGKRYKSIMKISLTRTAEKV